MYRRRRRLIRRGGVRKHLRRYVNNAITRRQPPKQFYTHARTGTALSVGSLYSHNLGDGIQKGVDRGDRIGDSIDYKGFKARVLLSTTNTVVAKIPRVRFLLVRNREPHLADNQNFFKGYGGVTVGSEGTVFTPDDFASGGDADQIWKPINRRKFQVVRDIKVKLLPADASSMGKHLRSFQIYVPLRFRLLYNPDSDGPASVSNPDYLKPRYTLYYFVEKDDSTADTPLVTLDLKVTDFFRG